MSPTFRLLSILFLALATSAIPALAASEIDGQDLYGLGRLKPIDSQLRVKTGHPAPDFSLPSISGKMVSLSQYRGKKNVVLSFVPAALTPICSNQWPGYNLQQSMFEKGDAVLLGISVDNIPTLYAWTRQMGHLWFEVLSDFWPHGAVAQKYGLLRTDGLSERASIFIDKQGIIRTTLVMDINKLSNPKTCALQLKKLNKK